MGDLIMRSNRTALLLLLALLLGSTSAETQVGAAGRLERLEGVRVRISVHDSRPVLWHAGAVTVTGPDSVTVGSDERMLVFPISSIQRIQVSKGLHDNAKRGALVGASMGAALVGGAALVDTLGCTSWCIISPGQALVMGSLLGTIPGALVGLLVGSTVQTERWADFRLGPVARTRHSQEARLAAAP
jgi:hypothetical protein